MTLMLGGLIATTTAIAAVRITPSEESGAAVIVVGVHPEFGTSRAVIVSLSVLRRKRY